MSVLVEFAIFPKINGVNKIKTNNPKMGIKIFFI